jgi:chemotaxis response regulator CheB
MRELVIEAITEQPDIEVVGEIKNEDEILDGVEGTHPDVLIIALGESSQRSSLCDILLRRYPEMKILALAPERNCGIYYWGSFEIHETSAEASEAGILSTLRHKNQPVGG